MDQYSPSEIREMYVRACAAIRGASDVTESEIQLIVTLRQAVAKLDGWRV
jgi:hypothetical protein